MTLARKENLANGNIYHICSRSIAKFEVFNTNGEYDRFINLLDLFRFDNFGYKYSQFNALGEKVKSEIVKNIKSKNDLLVNIICYCLMPTHFHLILEQKKDLGISSYIRRLLNGYSKYFNTKHHRTGPLWSSRFKSVLVENDEQLLHLTRYIHLNPTSANLVDKPEEWKFSSYNEFLNDTSHICNYNSRLDIKQKQYKKFVNDRKAYQKELSKIKSLIIDNYTG